MFIFQFVFGNLGGVVSWRFIDCMQLLFVVLFFRMMKCVFE